MKKQMVLLATFSALIALALPVHAQSGVKIKIPFDFVLADRTMPQGEYLISSLRDKVFVQNSQGNTVAVMLSNAVSGRAVGKSGQVIFQCYERQCFLSEVWNPTQIAGRQLLRSHREKEVARAKAPTYFALAGEARK